MRYMDYEEFNKEYKEFSDWWNNSGEFSPRTDELLWGKKKFTQLEGPHAKNDMWLDIDKWTGQEDGDFSQNTHDLLWGKEDADYKVKPIMGLVKNNITSTNFIPDDRVNSPSHYTSGRMESIDIIEDAISVAPTPREGFLQGQVLKYILRVWLKDNPLEDLKKARWYLDRLIKSLE